MAMAGTSQFCQQPGIGAQGTVFSLENLLTTKCFPSWNALEKEFSKKYFEVLKDKLQNSTFFPSQDQIFYALQLTPLETIKVVIVGQDPYTSAEKAMGLAFSVPPGVDVPESLQNIYTMLSSDIPGFKPPNHGCLVNWAQQGVLLLNSILTVGNQGESHANYGWKKFTKKIIEVVSENCDHVVFLLFGNVAHEMSCTNSEKHLVIEIAHPSPRSFWRIGGSRCFSECNHFLMGYGIPPINWCLPLILH